MSMQVAPSSEYLTQPRHSWWSSKTPLERKLVIACVISFLLCVTFFATTITFAVRPRYDSIAYYIPGDGGVCKTQVCVDTALTFKSFMDETVNPCDDFYNFTCGNFMLNTPAPETGLFKRGPFIDADSQLNLDIMDILKNNPLDEKIFNSTNSALHLYRECVKQESGDLPFLRDLLKRYFGGWPLIDQDWDENQFEWSQSLANVMREVDKHILFDLSQVPHPEDPSKYLLMMLFKVNVKGNHVVNQDFLRKPEMYATQKDLSESIRKVACLFDIECENSTTLDADISDLVAVIENPTPEIKDPPLYETGSELEDNVNLRLMTDDENRMYNLKRLSSEFPEVDWEKFFKLVFNDTEMEIHVDESFTVYTTKLILAPLLKVITSLNKRTVANYFAWKLVSFWGQLFSPEITKIVNPGMTQERNCQIFVSNSMSFAIGRLYIDKYFSQTMLEETNQMTGEVLQAFNETLKQNTWMDDTTKASALRKLNNMASSVASPDWAFNSTLLDTEYERIWKLKKFNFREGFAAARNSIFANEAKLLKGPVDRRNHWIRSPLATNAFYYQNLNAMFYQLGILTLPFYKFARPRAVNLGSLGYIAGHEITHGFDEMGRLRDETGRIKNWWTKEATDEFETRSKCLSNQYSTILNPLSGLKLDGKKTLSEDIADNGGLKAAFWAYKKFTQQQGGRLMGLEKYSEDQLFFIAAAHIWCTKTNADTMRNDIKTDNHSPNMYRAIIPFQNSPDFSKAFRCEDKSVMNPKEKCQIW